jgi:hypothetical protein
MAEEEAKATPPYIPWKTFTNFIERLKSTAIPSQIDNSVMPNLAVQVRGQVRSALRFLSLTDKDDNTSSKFRSLVEAYNSDSWARSWKPIITESYSSVVGDLNLIDATPRQLENRFRDNGGVSGQMMDKCIRFYLSAAESAGAAISHHLTARQSKAATNVPKTRKPKTTANVADETKDTENENASVRVLAFPVHGTSDVRIWLPTGLDVAHWTIIDAAVRGYIGISTKTE